MLVREKRLVQYYKFFEIADPSLIDIDFLPKYIEIINPIISRCITIAKSRVSYLKGENSQKILPPQQEQLNELPVPETLTKAKGIKLKTSLTSGQILYLFKTLKGIGVLEGQISNIDVCRFIAANLSTVGAEELSPENLAKVWSNIDPNDIAFWSNKFPDMSNQVIKDNPNKIKYKDRTSK